MFANLRRVLMLKPKSVRQLGAVALVPSALAPPGLTPLLPGGGPAVVEPPRCWVSAAGQDQGRDRN